VEVLLIVHATSWSDKRRTAERPIAQLIVSGGFDSIIEIIPSRPDIKAARYLSHDGQVLEHDDITPVPFLRDQLFGDRPLFPAADRVTLVGGVINDTGGGCLNVTFDFLVRYLCRLSKYSTITVPIHATYSAEQAANWEDLFEIEQITKDLVWKMFTAKASFELIFANRQLEARLGPGPVIRLIVDIAEPRPS